MKTNPDLENLTDNALMLRVKEGELDKLGLLFERYKKPLYGFFFNLNRQAAVSEDLVQNVFFRILKYRYLFRGEGDFKTWMFHIARNVSHDHYRKNKHKADPVESWQEQLGHSDHQDAQFQQDDERLLLAKALEHLSPDKREILMLSKFQEMKYKEIGDVIGCSEGAVKVKVFRALQDLKAVYKQLEKSM